jgi:hypothetical protein
MHWKLDNQIRRCNHYYIIKRMNLYINLTQCTLKDKISAYPCARLQLVSLYLVLLQSKRSYSKLFLDLTGLTDEQAVPPMTTTTTPVTSLLCLTLRLLSLPFCVLMPKGERKISRINEKG